MFRIITAAIVAGAIAAFFTPKPDAIWVYGHPGVTGTCGVEMQYGEVGYGLDVCAPGIYEGNGVDTYWSFPS